MIGKLYEVTKGWKTITSIIVIAVVAVLKYMGIVDDATAKLIFEFAGSLGLYGLYDKVRSTNESK